MAGAIDQDAALNEVGDEVAVSRMSSTNSEKRTNRTGRGAEVALAVDPMVRILAVGPAISPTLLTVLLILTIVLHGGAAGAATIVGEFHDIVRWNRGIKDAIAATLAQTYEVEVDKTPPPPPPAPEPPKEEPPKEETPPPQAPPPKADAPPPPPVAAEAAKVLTAENNDPVDLTGNTFVTGSGSTYAGGTTQAGGTSKQAVYNPAAAATGKPGGTGTAPSPAPVGGDDKSRGAGLVGGTDWRDCPFPAEADAEQIDQAYVTLRVSVRADGSAETVEIIQDGGHGFGREARKCAMRKKYATALDRSGTAIPGQTKPIRVHFER